MQFDKKAGRYEALSYKESMDSNVNIENQKMIDKNVVISVKHLVRNKIF